MSQAVGMGRWVPALSAAEVMCGRELVSRGAGEGVWRAKRQQCQLAEEGKRRRRGRAEGVGRRKGRQGMRSKKSKGRKARGAVGG